MAIANIVFAILMVNANARVFVNSNLLQVMVFSKKQSEKEIDEMHSSYSKSDIFFLKTLSLSLAKDQCQQSSSVKGCV